MERNEPTLVPEWLKSSGSVSGGGSSVHHFASSATHSDVSPLSHHTRNRNSKNINDFDTPRLDRTASSNSRRSSSNGSAKHAYSSFNRSHRDKDRDRDKERPSYGDIWDRDSSDPLGNLFNNRSEKDTLRRSQSMVSRKPNEMLPRRVAVDSKISSSNTLSNGNGLLAASSSIKKSVFEKDFPSLGTEEKPVPDVGRVSSPGLSSAVQSLPVGNSTLIGGEGWTSALAEVPPIIGSSSSTGTLSAPQTTVATALSGPPSATTGLNMAEALAQAPSRTRTAPQLSVKTQRREELAIKQSRQLIPVTPSMPKSSVLSFSDKSKPKLPASRVGEMNLATKNGQQQPSMLHHANQSHAGGNVKSDAQKTSGKLLVLKPSWENGVLSSPKDVVTPTNNVNSRAATNQVAVAPPVASAPMRTSINPKVPPGERKTATMNPIAGFTIERKPSLSQTQSRNDFFNLLKKKTSTNSSTVQADSGPDSLCPSQEKPGEMTKDVVTAPAIPHGTENGVEVAVNGETHEKRLSDTEEKDTSLCETVLSEEEAAFLRSLGWEEENNDEDDVGLTQEEINAFFRQCDQSGIRVRLSELHINSIGGGSSEVGSSDSESKA